MCRDFSTNGHRLIEDKQNVAAGALDARTTARKSVESIFDIAEADGVALYFWDTERCFLVPITHVGPLLEEKELPVVYPGQGLIGATLRAGRALALENDYAASPHMTPWARDYGIRAEYALPLFMGERVLGVLSVMYGHVREINAALRSAIGVAAAPLLAALETLRPLADAERSVAESMTLAKLLHDTAAHVDVHMTCARVIEAACRLTGADYGFTAVGEKAGALRLQVAWGMSSEQERAAERRSFFVGMSAEDHGSTRVITRLAERPEAQEDETRTLLIVPLNDGAECLGRLVLGWRVDAEPTLRHIALAETLAQHACAALTHARAIERVLGHGAQAPGDLALVFDASLIVRYASPSYRCTLGWEPADMIGRRFLDFVLPDDASKTEQHITLSRLEHGGRIQPFAYRVRHADGSTRVLQSRGVNRSEDPVIGGWVLHGADVTSERRSVNGSGSASALADREDIEAALHAAVREARGQHFSLALIVTHLNRFGAVLGDVRSEVAEGLLREVEDRLRSVLHGGDRVGRLGADEFLIIAVHADEAAARERMGDLLQVMAQPFLVGDDEQRFPVSIGATVDPKQGVDAPTLLRQAGAAAREAQRTGLGSAFYDVESDRSAAARVLAVAALREAIAHDELRLYYQPIFDVRTGEVLQAEALCRWPTAPSGLQSPDAFIALAEHAGLIGSLTQWVIRNAVGQWSRWRDIAPASLSINISMEDLSEPDLAERFERIFAQLDVEPARICLELTESALLVDVERSVRTLERLAALGVSFSIDDFGTGYTSLSYLKRFPVNELKIDRSFVTNLENDAHDRTIVRSIIDLAHGLGMRVVAEGVETPGALAFLREWNCDRAQGHLVAAAMPPEQFAERFFQPTLR